MPKGACVVLLLAWSAAAGKTAALRDAAPAEWVGNELPMCVLLLHFGEEGVSPSDPSGRCSDTFCGARGGFDDTSLERAKKQ